MSITCVKERSKLIFTKTNGRIATYDLADQGCYNFQGRKVKSLNSYFANYGFSEITWANPTYREFVRTVLRSESRLRNVGSLLTHLHHYRNNEGYLLLNLPTFGRMSKPISEYSKPARKFLVNKFAGTGNTYTFRRWCRLFEENDSDKIRVIQLTEQLELTNILNFDTYNVDYIYDMTVNYSMDLKSLLVQLSNYIRREGLTLDETIRNLKDYNSMSKKMTTKYHKYPKYLLSTHRIVVKNYNSFRETYEEQEFLNQVDNSLSHKGVTYSVLVPTKPSDVQEEGAQQNHCVASYVSSIINGTTQIVFMRNNNNIDKPLLTIEVKNGKIYQVKGIYNRQATSDEMSFITTYAKAKKLTIGKYL